jgi:CRISPR-associated endonuclease Cas3-HD
VADIVEGIAATASILLYPHFYAHSRQNPDGTPQPPEQWEPLHTGTGAGHLERVALRTSQFAAMFGAEDWGRLAGMWHDLGKYSAQFQDYLRQQNGFEAHLEQTSRVDHSTAGAQLASQSVPKWGRLLAYVIAAHHAGLADADKLTARLQKQIEPWEQNAELTHRFCFFSRENRSRDRRIGHAGDARSAHWLFDTSVIPPAMIPRRPRFATKSLRRVWCRVILRGRQF